MSGLASVPDSGKRADIQGLRAIAVLAVLVFHALPEALPGGFVGVDIFFVLSGYLITRIILPPLEQRRFSLLDFYRRRVRRLFPALFTMLGITMLIGIAVLPPALLVKLAESQFFTTLFASNFYFADKTGYFDLSAEQMPLLNTWSLGVEEQFYLLYPLVLWLVVRWIGPAKWAVLTVLAITSLIQSQIWTGTDPDTAFYHPASRAFELLIGALVVGLERRWTPGAQLSQWAGLFAASVLVASLFLIGPRTSFPGIAALAPTLATATLLLIRQGWMTRAISIRPMVLVGDISYSLYLWHWPLLVFGKFLFPGSAIVIAIAVLLSFLAAWASWRYIEQPILQHKNRRLFLKAAGVMAGSIALCLAVYLPDGWPVRFGPDARALLAGSSDYNPDRPDCHMRSDRPRPYDEMCVYGAEGAVPGYAVWGDSHGTELAMALGERLAARGEALKSITMSGCPATVGRRPDCTKQVLSTKAGILADPSMHTIILTSNLHGKDEYSRAAVDGVTATARDLAAAGKRVVIVFPIPTYDWDPPSSLAMRLRRGGDPATVSMPRSRYERKSGHIVRRFETLAAETPGIYGIDAANLFCTDTACYPYREEIGMLYYNKGHLSLTGAGVLADSMIERQLVGLAASESDGM